MESPDLPAIVFDRMSRKLEYRIMMRRCQARLMQVSHLALLPIGYLGVSRVHAAINKAIRPTSDTLILENGNRFRFPSNDYYWNRLLDANWQYEPEIDAFLRAAGAVPFVFDLGANFGYWSTRVGSGLYGSHRSIAVEPSAAALAVLGSNTHGLPQPVTIYHRAIDAVSGKKVFLYGERHAGLSIDENWFGASSNRVNEVETIAIDDLLAQEKIDANEIPVLIKLDVEGAETRKGMAGATRTLAGQSAFLIEDAQKNAASEAVRHLHGDLGMSLFRFDRGSFHEIRDLDEIKGLKARQSSWQGVGLNLMAAASPSVEERDLVMPHTRAIGCGWVMLVILLWTEA